MGVRGRQAVTNSGALEGETFRGRPDRVDMAVPPAKSVMARFEGPRIPTHEVGIPG